MKEKQSRKNFIVIFLCLVFAGVFFILPAGSQAAWQSVSEVEENLVEAQFVEAHLTLDEDGIQPSDVADFLKPGSILERSALINNESEIDFKYSVLFEKDSGDSLLCNNLFLTAYKANEEVYADRLTDFEMSYFLESQKGDDWRFVIGLIDNASEEIQGLECSFDIIYEAYLEEETGWRDREVISNNEIKSGFWVVPKIEFVSPSTGSVWQVGQDISIQWQVESADSSKNDSVVIDLHYACDGEIWEEISLNEVNDGEFLWTIPERISDTCRIKITALDVYDYQSELVSDDFEISWMIAINEFLVNPTEGKEFVEIVNYGPISIDVESWFVTDDDGPDSHKRIIDAEHTNIASTILDANENNILVVTNYYSFYLNNTGSDEVRLYDSQGRLIDGKSFTDAPVGLSYSRIPDGQGNWEETDPTPGESN